MCVHFRNIQPTRGLRGKRNIHGQTGKEYIRLAPETHQHNSLMVDMCSLFDCRLGERLNPIFEPLDCLLNKWIINSATYIGLLSFYSNEFPSRSHPTTCLPQKRPVPFRLPSMPPFVYHNFLVQTGLCKPLISSSIFAQIPLHSPP